MNRAVVLTWSEVQAMCRAALSDGRPDVASLFALASGYGLRVGDVLRLRWRDLLGPDGNIVDRLEVREKKRGALRVLRTPKWVKDVLERYREALGPDLDPDAKLFRFGREWCWELTRRYAQRAGIKKAPVSPHSLRKSFCSEVYLRTRDPALTARLTGHRSPEALLAYIGALTPTAERILDELCSIPFD